MCFDYLPHKPDLLGPRTIQVHICSDPPGPDHYHRTSEGRVTSSSRWPHNTRGQAKEWILCIVFSFFDNSFCWNIGLPPTIDNPSSSYTASHPFVSNCTKHAECQFHFCSFHTPVPFLISPASSILIPVRKSSYDFILSFWCNIYKSELRLKP